MQYTLIKETESSLKTVSHGVPQGSVLGPVLFILLINDMYNSLEYCEVHHYADETNLLLTDNPFKKINRQVNCDLSLICHCHWVKKINLNGSKTEIIIFQPKNKQIRKHLDFRISGHKINTCRYVKYLGAMLVENLD